MFYAKISKPCVGGAKLQGNDVAKMENIHDFLVIG